MDLSNRDVVFLLAATAAWLWAILTPMGRGIVRPVLTAMVPLAPWFLAFGTYFVLVVALFHYRGLWTPGILKETLAWLVLGGLLVLWRSSSMYADPPRFRRAIARSLGITAGLEFVLGLVSFSVVLELGLLLGAGLLTLLTLAPAPDESSKRVVLGAKVLLALLGLSVLIGTVVVLAQELPGLDKPMILFSILLSIWATLATLPFVFVVQLLDKYAALFGEVDRRADGDPERSRRAKVALVLFFHVRGRALNSFAPFDVRDLVTAQNLGQARRIIALQQAEWHLRVATSQLAEARLARFAGVPGTDWNGAPLDQREFEATKEVLGHLALVQQNQYRMRTRYSADRHQLIAGLWLRSLPADPGISMTVRRRGQSWYAWRQTIGGWYVGVGAMKPPPDRWTYVGSEPPMTPPRPGSGWRRGDFDEDTAA